MSVLQSTSYIINNLFNYHLNGNKDNDEKKFIKFVILQLQLIITLNRFESSGNSTIIIKKRQTSNKQ